MSALSLPGLSERLFAQRKPPAGASGGYSPLHRAPGLLREALGLAVRGFPTIQPIFGGIFLPGGTSTQLVNASSWSAFNSQLQTLAGSGYRLASLTAIQSNKATAYYGAFEQGTANYVVLHTADPAQFQQAFTQNQSGYRLVDFAITWEQGQLYYVGYWLATSSPANQTLVFDVDGNTLGSRWTALSNRSYRRDSVSSLRKSGAPLLFIQSNARRASKFRWTSMGSSNVYWSRR